MANLQTDVSRVIIGSELDEMIQSYQETLNMDDFAKIEGGTFAMGSTEGDADEQPVHQVTVDSFSLSKTTVTNAEYAQFMASLGDKRFAAIAKDSTSSFARVIALGNNREMLENLPIASLAILFPNAGDALTIGALKTFLDPVAIAYLGFFDSPTSFDAPLRPRVKLNWFDSFVYAFMHGGRLPTEAEWEFAARVKPDGSLRKYSTPNDDLREARHSAYKEVSTTAGVNDPKYPALPNGLRHMTGNVSEWVQDFYAPYSAEETINPRGPATGRKRVLRGGSWRGRTSDSLRAAQRYAGGPWEYLSRVGFRFVVPS